MSSVLKKADKLNLSLSPNNSFFFVLLEENIARKLPDPFLSI